MNTRRVGLAAFMLAVVVALLMASISRGWWDTQIMYGGEAQRVAHIEAQDAQLGGGAEIIDDQPPFGPPAGDGKAVVLKPGDGTITWSVDLDRSTYRLFAIARVPEAIPWQNGAPEWPMFARLRVTGPDGAEVGDWTMQINYLNTYYDTARISFPAHHEGRYTLEFSITGASEAELVVDRLDLRDELGNTLKAGFKDGRYMRSDEEVARLRENFRAELMDLAEVETEDEFRALLADPQRRAALINRFNQESGSRFNRYGQGVLDRAIMNLADGPPPVGDEPDPDEDAFQRHTESLLREWGEDYSKWNTRFDGRDVLGAHGGAFLPNVAEDYLITGDPEIALMMARTLIGIADLYPALDWSAQKFQPGELGSGNTRGIRFTFTSGRFGKIQYSGWEVGYPENFAKMYDAIFPFIEEHGDELAAMARTRIPWIENKDDLIAFLDTRLLQYVGDCLNRNRIRTAQGGSENMMLHTIAAQGPNPAGEMMARWLFTRTYWDMTNDGGIQDQAITGRLRDGSNTIGSVGYTEAAGTVLVSAAEMMSRYIDAGGSREYDLSDVNRFPAVLAGAFFPLESRVAGGYQPLIGDWGRSLNARIYHTIGNFGQSFRFAFRNTRDPRMAWLMKNVVGRTIETDEEWALIEELAAGQRDPQLSSVSRNLEGFGLAIMEAGVQHDDFTRKRALTFRHGVGKGHAHADALTLEYYANGVRALPGAGNRGGRPHPGNMNTKPGVTVDGGSMRNTSEINVGGTGWTTAFMPEPGAQYVSGSARFGMVPQVERYERQTALIDIEGLDGSYVFDVLRVAGGREHIWSMHGPASGPDDAPEYNFDLRQPDHPEAGRILHGFNNPQQGVAGDVVVADWLLGRDIEQRMLDVAFDETLPPLTTRSMLMGHAGAELFTGESDPDARGLESSQWMTTIRFIQARRAGEDGLQTVWPHLIESYRGEPYITEAELLAATPADDSASAPVAMSIVTDNGQRDLIISDGEGDREITAGGATMNGRFGYISRDEQGFRLAHLATGTRLEHEGLVIQAEAAEYDARIVEVDYLNRRIRLDRPLPATAPDGIELLIGAPDRPQGWKAESIDGDTITLAYSPILYQSSILSVDEDEGSVVCSMNPNLLLADPRYYDNVVATDESGENAWRVQTMTPKYIFMYMQEPILDWHEIYTLDDFPDADGDGRRTVTITNWGEGDPRRDLTVEVAFVDVERQVVYFHLPEDEDVVAASGWAWAGSRLAAPEQNRWMINEAGKRWISNYTGKSNAIMLEGEVRDDMFTDATGDGRRVLRMYHFGVGDSVRMSSNVVIRRIEDGVYDMKSSTPARATLPDGTELEIR